VPVIPKVLFQSSQKNKTKEELANPDVPGNDDYSSGKYS